MLKLPFFHCDTEPLSINENFPLSIQVVIDTEEEFDWSAEPSRSSVGVSHFREMYRLQEIFDKYNVKPCYAIDYPIATSELSRSILKSWVNEGRCEIGAHLHPWVNPPYIETLSPSNMYPGNLPLAIEENKIAVLLRAIEDNIGVAPRAYKAGRYGFGPNTLDLLLRFGLDIDLSFAPGFDMRDDGGPDHSTIDPGPFMVVNKSGRVLSLPATGSIIGSFPKLFSFGKALERLKLTGLFSRLGLSDRLRLSPEGFTFLEQVKLINELISKGQRVFTLSLHSSSVMVGGNPYSTNDNDVKQLLHRTEAILDYFTNELRGKVTSPTELKEKLIVGCS